MIEAIQIGEKTVKLKATGNTPRKYRELFNKDLIVEMQRFIFHIKDGTLTGDFDFGTIERLAYTMALQYDSEIGTIDDWLDQFDIGDIYGAMRSILGVWNRSKETTTEQKKSTDN